MGNSSTTGFWTGVADVNEWHSHPRWDHHEKLFWTRSPVFIELVCWRGIGRVIGTTSGAGLAYLLVGEVAALANE